MRLVGTAIALAAVTVVLGGCETLFGEKEKEPLPGTRIAVLSQQRTLSADAATGPIVLPPPITNPEWPQDGGSASNAMHHLRLGTSLQQVFSVGAGAGIESDAPQMPPPIVAAGRIFTMDSANEVRAFDAASGRREWRADLADDEDDAVAGGLAYARGRIVATTGFAKVFALDAGSGKEVWARAVNAPIHGPPTVSADGRIFVVTINNTLYALDPANGADLWPPHQALAEAAGLLGTASPAADDDLVVAAFSSGDVVALRPATGRVVWQEALAPARRIEDLASLSHVRGRPVLDRGQVFAVSYGGVLAAINARTGARMWERDIGSLHGPWLAGDALFIVSSQQELIALDRATGAIHWIAKLPFYADEKNREDPILWAGPVLAGDRLIVLSSHGEAWFLSPYTGEKVAALDLRDGASRLPVIADGRLYVLTDDGVLAAYQ
jgi:outer membrane protein assembly factor BamB